MRQSPHGTPYPEGSRVVHIGLPKTGTSTVQAALHTRRDELARHDVLYAGRRRHSRRAVKAALGQSRPWFAPGGAREWAGIVEEVRSSDARCVVFSSESLSAAPPAFVRRLVDDFGGDLQILVTVRPLAGVLASVWQQGLRVGMTKPLVQTCEEILSDPPADPWARGIRRRFRLHRYLRTWGGVVGEEALTFVVPDPSDRAMLTRVVEELLALPDGTLAGVPQANQSLPFPEAELLRHFAVAFEQAGGDHVTWMRTVASVETHGLLQALSVRAEPHAITVPRWAAERANELTEPSLRAIRASNANVVGDLGHLLVDPARYEESWSAPATVRIDSAAELAHALHLAGVRRGRLERVAPRVTRPDLDAVAAAELVSRLRTRVARRLRG